MPNPVVHFDVFTPDYQGAAKFYADLFGWHVDPNVPPGMRYAFIDTHDPTGVNGGYTSTADAPSTVVYAEVDDVQGYLDKVVAAGGSVHTPVTVVPDVVTYAVFTDPFGVRFGLIQVRDD